MTTYRFTVPGQPHPAERPRQVSRPGGRKVWITPNTTLEAEGRVLAAFIRTFPRAAPLSGDVVLLLTFYRATRRRADVDNLTKTVMDALNGHAWADDSQVAALGVTRILGVQAGAERTLVTVTDECATLVSAMHAHTNEGTEP